MKTVTVTFPITEAVDILRLLRGEAKCLLEQNENLHDIDLQKRANNVLSARERIITSLEEIASLEDTVQDPSQMALNVVVPPCTAQQALIDDAVGGKLAELSGEKVVPVRPAVQFRQLHEPDWSDFDDDMFDPPQQKKRNWRW